MISEDECRDIAHRAASLFERLRGLETEPGQAAPPNPGALAALKSWNQAFAPGDNQAFQRRLEWDGLDERRVLWVLSQAPPHGKVPAWTSWLTRFLEASPRFAGELKSGETFPEAGYFGAAVQPPFLELWVPILRAARRALQQAAGDDLQDVAEPARLVFERQLLKEIALLGELAAYEQFSGFRGWNPSSQDPAPQGVYRAFILEMLDGALASFFTSYPVLSRNLVVLTESWITTVGELFGRLRRDRALIGRFFCSGEDPGELIRAEAGLSDRHDGGRRVAALGFESGLQLIYKPRDVGIERAFNDLLSWAVNEGLEPRPAPLRVLEREDYGWVERVEPGRFEDREAVRCYYRKSGGLLCIAYVLRGSDLHMENLIASGNGPVLIDSEMLVQPVCGHEMMRDLESPETVEARVGETEDSCLATGLLSLIQSDPNGEPYDIGGLRGRGGFVWPVKKRVWQALGTDSLHYLEETAIAPARNNEVVLNEQVQKPDDFMEDVLSGYTDTYRFLLSERERIMAPDGPLDLFRDRRARVVFRTSKQYAVLQYILSAPQYQRSGTRRSFVVDALNRTVNREKSRPLLWPLVADERRALESLDIPRFTIGTTGTTLTTANGEQVSGYFARSGFAAVTDRVRILSEEHLHDQLHRLRSALLSSVDSRFHTELPAAETVWSDKEGSVASDETLVEYAVWIGRELVTRASCEEGALTWDAIAHLGRQSRKDPLAPYNLYDGLAGVGMFLASLGAVTGDHRWLEHARSAVHPLEAFLDRPDTASVLRTANLGGCNGLGSIVYALVWLGRFLEDESFTELSLRVCRLICRDRIDSDRYLDVAGGSAGAILSVLALVETVRDAQALDIAVACGERLLATRVEAGDGAAAWPSRDGRLLAGFAHGAAGIAYALARLFKITGNESYLEAVRAAHRFERRLFSPVHGNWPVVEAGGGGVSGAPGFMTAWCHGAPGLGLARALALDVVSDEDILAEIGSAVTTTLSAERHSADHLCCGNLGRADFLLTVGHRLQRSELVDSARAVAGQAVERTRARGHFALPSTPFEYHVFTPGFFQGVSGIGYQLLRIAAPYKLPSVLGFEAKLGGVAGPRLEEAEYGED